MTVSFTEPGAFATVYTNIARQLLAAEATQDTLSALSGLAVQIVPGAEQASITRGRSGTGFETVASTSDVALQADKIQYDLVSGPCVDAILKDRLFRADDLRTDDRWPEFGTRAFEATGVLSMLSIRLFLEEDTGLLIGLNMYSRELAAFDDESQIFGLLLATHGALGIAAARAREQAVNLRVALDSRTEIGIAMGILMNQHKINRANAFTLLRISSQHVGRKLHDVATDVSDTGVLPLPHDRTTRRTRSTKSAQDGRSQSRD